MAAEQAERWLSVACASPGERARAAICPPNCAPGQDLAHELPPETMLGACVASPGRSPPTVGAAIGRTVPSAVPCGRTRRRP
jgi:hypothetical protein